MSLPHVLKRIRLELARSKDFPTGYRAGLIVGRLIAVLIVTNLVAMTLDSVPALQAQYGPLFTAIELLSLVLFTIEYGLRVWVAAEHAPHRPSSERKALRPLRSSLD